MYTSFKLYWYIQQSLLIHLIWRENLTFSNFSCFQSVPHFVLSHSFLSFCFLSRSFFCSFFSSFLKNNDLSISHCRQKQCPLSLCSITLHPLFCSPSLSLFCYLLQAFYPHFFFVFCSLPVTINLWHVQNFSGQMPL